MVHGATATPLSLSRSAHGWRRRLPWAILVLALAFTSAAMFGIYIGLFDGNVRTVVPGKLYRSAQIAGDGVRQRIAAWSGNSLDEVIRRYGIHTVINLRGGRPNDTWYREEVATTRADGARHLDYGLSAVKLPPPTVLRDIINAFDHFKPKDYPLLIHCEGGADRTGLTSAIYVNVYDRVPLEAAVREQLTWRNGHFPFFPSRTGAMDLFFKLYRAEDDGLNLHDWILKRYPTIYTAQPDTLKVSQTVTQRVHLAAKSR